MKPAIYTAHGVRELWVICVEGSLVHLHRDPARDGYGLVERAGADEPLTARHAPAELAFTLDDVRPR